MVYTYITIAINTAYIHDLIVVILKGKRTPLKIKMKKSSSKTINNPKWNLTQITQYFAVFALDYKASIMSQWPFTNNTRKYARNAITSLNAHAKTVFTV